MILFIEQSIREYIMNKEEKRKLLMKREAIKAVELLKNDIGHVRYVKDWAMLAGCSKTKLNQLIKEEYSVTAKAMMKKIRLEAIETAIMEHPSLGSYGIAQEAGLGSEQDIYRFLNRNFDTTFTDLQFDLLWGRGG